MPAISDPGGKGTVDYGAPWPSPSLVEEGVEPRHAGPLSLNRGPPGNARAWVPLGGFPPCRAFGGPCRDSWPVNRRRDSKRPACRPTLSAPTPKPSWTGASPRWPAPPPSGSASSQAGCPCPRCRSVEPSHRWSSSRKRDRPTSQPLGLQSLPDRTCHADPTAPAPGGHRPLGRDSRIPSERSSGTAALPLASP